MDYLKLLLVVAAQVVTVAVLEFARRLLKCFATAGLTFLILVYPIEALSSLQTSMTTINKHLVLLKTIDEMRR